MGKMKRILIVAGIIVALAGSSVGVWYVYNKPKAEKPKKVVVIEKETTENEVKQEVDAKEVDGKEYEEDTVKPDKPEESANKYKDTNENTVGNTTMNIMSQMNVTSQGESIYYVQNNKIIRNSMELTDKKVVAELEFNPQNLNIIGSNLYYSSDGIYTSVLGERAIRKICNDSALYMHVIGTTIYYLNESDDGKLYSIGTDGSNRSMVVDRSHLQYLQIQDDIIYFKTEEGLLFQCLMDGTGEQKINLPEDCRVESFQVVEENVIYSQTDSITKTNSTNIQDTVTLCEEKSLQGIPQVRGDDVFYVVEGGLNKVTISGAQKVLLNNELNINTSYGRNGCLALIDDMLYYFDNEDGGLLYRVNLDGTGAERVS